MDQNASLKTVAAGAGDLFAVAGACLTWKARGEDTDGRFCFFEQTLEPGEGVPLHTHSYAEAFYVLEGSVEFESDGAGEPIRGRRGDTVVAGPGIRHAFYNRGAETVRLLSISAGEHQRFFDAVAEADRQTSFATMERPDAMRRIAEIGAATDTVFLQN